MLVINSILKVLLGKKMATNEKYITNGTYSSDTLCIMDASLEFVNPSIGVTDTMHVPVITVIIRISFIPMVFIWVKNIRKCERMKHSK